MNAKILPCSLKTTHTHTTINCSAFIEVSSPNTTHGTAAVQQLRDALLHRHVAVTNTATTRGACDSERDHPGHPLATDS